MTDQSLETGDVRIGDAVIERTADDNGVDAEALADALVVLHASLIGSHSEFERDHEYVTVDDVRAYRVPRAVWDELLEAFDFDEEVAAAVEAAHSEQARLLFADAVGVDERFDDDERGVVVGVETAEEF